MRIILAVLSVAFLGQVQAADQAPPPPIRIFGAAPEVITFLPDGAIVLRGKTIGKDLEAYKTISQGLGQIQQRLDACETQLAKATKK